MRLQEELNSRREEEEARREEAQRQELPPPELNSEDPWVKAVDQLIMTRIGELEAKLYERLSNSFSAVLSRLDDMHTDMFGTSHDQYHEDLLRTRAGGQPRPAPQRERERDARTPSPPASRSRSRGRTRSRSTSRERRKRKSKR